MSTGLVLPRIPNKLVIVPALSDAQFEQMCAANSDVPLERNHKGEIVVREFAGFDMSTANSEITYQLHSWGKQDHAARSFGSNLGIFLPDGSSMSPCAAYVTAEQVSRVTVEDRTHFLRFAPAFVIELRSKTDSLNQAFERMNHWMAGGVLLGWLIDFNARAVYVYEEGKNPRMETGETVSGSGPMDGFVLDLNEVWCSYGLI